LKVEQELREVFGHLRRLLEVNMDIGLDPPALTSRARRYLDGDVSWERGRSVLLDQVDSLEALKAFIGDCTRCKLHKGRTKLVFGEGSPNARLVFVGEGPGHEEDLEGRPFVGEAGRLLTRIIKAMGLTREEVFICNVVKCRPPGNREPEKDEVETCSPFLKRQLSLVKPEVICSLGRVAGQTLLGRDFMITLERGKWHSYADIPVMPTYHPAYLLRHASAKRQVWEDVQQVMQRLGLEVKKK
jgi:uracil-DNA glycosylase family 4